MNLGLFTELNDQYNEYLSTVKSRPNDVKYYKMVSENTTLESGHVMSEMIVQCSFGNNDCNLTA